jgi:hypothetical protein
MMRNIILVATISLIALAGFGVGFVHAQNASAQPGQTSAVNKESVVPAYHPNRPMAPLPETLDPAQFTDIQTQNIYALAANTPVS